MYVYLFFVVFFVSEMLRYMSVSWYKVWNWCNCSILRFKVFKFFWVFCVRDFLSFSLSICIEGDVGVLVIILLIKVVFIFVFLYIVFLFFFEDFNILKFFFGFEIGNELGVISCFVFCNFFFK